jgi:hypothetical protein
MIRQFQKTLSRIFESARTGANPGPAQNDQSYRGADNGFVVPEEARGGSLSKFLLEHAGGYAHKYYTREDAKQATMLAGTKFLSVSFATFSFMKAVQPAFDSINPDMRGYFTALAAGGMWWGISKLDTAVLHNVLANRAEKLARAESPELRDHQAGTAWPGIALRIGISASSLGISIPALLVATSLHTVNADIRNNSPAIQQYEERVANNDRAITAMRARLSDLQRQLTITQSPDGALTSEQRARIAELTTLQQQAAAEQRQRQQDLEQAEQRRDEAAARMAQEERGTHGAIPGKHTKYYEALTDKENAERDMARARTAISRLQAGVERASAESTQMRSQSNPSDTAQRPDIAMLAQTLQQQISQVSNDLDRQLAQQKAFKNTNHVSPQDPRYSALHPDLPQQFQAYQSFMMTKATPLDWSLQIFLATFFISAELGVFALASTRKLNGGDMNGYRAQITNLNASRHIAKRTRQIEELHTELRMDEELVSLNRAKAVTSAADKLFDDQVKKVMSDPETVQKAEDEVRRILKARRKNGGPKKPVPS